MAEDQTPTQGHHPLVVNLQVVSPSVGVNQPLNFPGLPPTTTIRELKAKIREALPLRPIDDHQRLIHRGRLLSRDNDTLEDVFGAELLRNTDQQSLHLVLRDSPDHHPPHPPQPAPHAAPNRGQSPAPGIHPAQNPHMHHFRHAPRHIPPNFAHFPAAPMPAGALADPHLAALNHQQQIQQQLQQHQTMMQWMNQLQREGRHSPVPAQPGTVTREMIGPNGQYIRMTFNTNGGVPVGVNNSNSPQPGNGPTSAPRGHFSPADIQNIIGRHDAAQATQTMTEAMHRSASGTSLVNMATNLNGPIQPVAPGVTTPMFPSLSRHASRTATPEPQGGRAPGNVNGPAFSGLAPQPQTGSRAQNPARPPSQTPEVYILSSPAGPRGLLVAGSDIYVTPIGSSSPAIQARNLRQPPFTVAPPIAGQLRPTPTTAVQQAQQLAPPNPQAQGQQHQIQPQVQPQQGHPIPVRRAPRVIHPNNPGAGAMVAAAWPHIWLVIRLAAFVWWFTSSDSSWTRWITIITIAAIVFIINTGMLNGAAGQAWEPIRRHLEGLLPLADPNQPPPLAPAAPQAADEGRGGRQQHPNPAETAARLVAEHRNTNANWLLNQVRRAERAGLLFLASIAPGVAERHIAHLEAQERAERQRREEAEAAAAAAAAEAAAAVAAEGTSNSEENQEGTAPSPDTPASGDVGQNEHQAQLIDV
ncbi:hypothetical protein GQ53DRAFT_298021 [Thozetella sp. PMI_491]|nr:hypothetical protein GQ53DRAFT_298021 [Thozetella sp. PMI_491]